MKAAYIEKFGGPEVLILGDLPEPVAGPGQIVVETAAASINGRNRKLKSMAQVSGSDAFLRCAGLWRRRGGQGLRGQLLQQLRQRLRKWHGAPRDGKAFGLATVFSREAVQMPAFASCESVDGNLNCHGYGSSVTVTATFGMCAAGWVLQQLASRAAA